MTKKILVTGSTGFVGKQVLKSLSNEDVELRLIVRTESDYFSKALHCPFEVIRTENLFTQTRNWWEEHFIGIDSLLHLAWYAEPGKYLQSSKNIECLTGSLEMAKGAVQANVKRFVGVGTCFEYDLSHSVFSIETPLKPTSPYAGAKTALYNCLSQWLPSMGIELAWCRLFYLFGEGEDPRRLVPSLHENLKNKNTVNLTTGKQIRDYMDVSDAAKIISDILLGTQQGPVNVCSGIPITVRQLSEKIADIYNSRELLNFGARPENSIDPPCVLGIKNFEHY